MDREDMGGVGEGSSLGRREDLVQELCRAYEPQLLRYLTRMLGRVDVAREVVQDTYEKIHKLYRLEDVLFPRAMFYKIATNFALMRLRRARLESTIITGSAGMEKVPDEAASPDKRAIAEEINERLVQTIKELRPNLRVVLVMAHVQGIARKDIAERLGISLKRVDKRMTQALRALRQRMESFGIDPLRVE
ncbi:MAG: RNA polymerase sigma factor [Steroidobacteraceae bacterium]